MQIKTLPFVMSRQRAGCSEQKKERFSTAAVIAAAGAAFLMTNVRIGGIMSPFAAVLTASLPVCCGAAAFMGTAASALAGAELWGSITEIAASGVMLLYSYIFGKYSDKKLKAIVCGIVYFICACAVAAGDGGGWVMFLAVLLRSFMCAGLTWCMCDIAGVLSDGYDAENSESFAVSLGIIYMLFIASLSAREAGFANIGRIAAGMITAAAARKFGMKGGGAAGILSAAAFLMAEQSLGRCGAIVAFSGLASGMYSSKGKYAVNIAFITSAFAVTAAAGMPSGTTEFIIDMGIAAALYCIIPERLYMTKLNVISTEKQPADNVRIDRLDFAAKILGEVGNDVEKASAMLSEHSGKSTEELSDVVKSMVCSRFCSQRKCSAACGSLTQDVYDSCFRSAQTIAESKGSVAYRELPAGFEGCTKKTQIADSYNYALGMRRIQSRKEAYARRFLEGASEQLEASCNMFREMALQLGNDVCENSSLSAAAEKLIRSEGFDLRSAVVCFDKHMNAFAEAFIDAQDNFSAVYLNELTEKLSELLGTELEKPVMISCGEGGRTQYRIRWRSTAAYYPDSSIIACAAESGICGDSHSVFEDGLGNYYVILADGMGKGGRAAAESGMAVSLLRRLILSGIGRESAVKTLNVLMSAASSDETFTTVDMLEINLYSGRCRLTKLGAAPTIVFSKEDGEGAVSVYDECGVPVGIIGKTDITDTVFEADENTRIVMMTDGIDCGGDAFVEALVENERFTCEQIADRIIARSDEIERESEEKMRRRDDKTAAVIRLYKSGR